MEQTAAERTAAAVRAELARRRIAGRELGRRLGWSSSSMGRRLAGETPFRVHELQAIAAHLGIPVAALLAEDVAA